MRLDSVREVKAQVVGEDIPRLREAVARGELGVSARGLDRSAGPPRTIAVGIAPTGGHEYRLAVRVQRRGLEGSEVIEDIRRRAAGEVDVRYIGRVFKQCEREWNRRRDRPLLIGCSVGHRDVTAGTLGAFVTLAGGGAGLLSNNHVLADENDGERGDPILQPGRYDGGGGRDRVGRLERFVTLDSRGGNTVDAAVARLDTGIEFQPARLCGLGPLTGLAPEVRPGAPVHKLGRTTGHTRGNVSAIEVDGVIVGYDMGNLRFDDQIEIDSDAQVPFSQGGDSGSLILTEDRSAAALLFAGSDHGGRNGAGVTFANPVGQVLGALSVRLHAE